MFFLPGFSPSLSDRLNDDIRLPNFGRLKYAQLFNGLPTTVSGGMPAVCAGLCEEALNLCHAYGGVLFLHTQPTGSLNAMLTQMGGIVAENLTNLDPMKDAETAFFIHYNECVERYAAHSDKVDIAYIRAVKVLCEAGGMAATLFRLEDYAYEADISRDVQALLRRGNRRIAASLRVSDETQQRTRNVLTQLCEQYHGQLNSGAAKNGVSLASALNEGRIVSIDIGRSTRSRSIADIAQLMSADPFRIVIDARRQKPSPLWQDFIREHLHSVALYILPSLFDRDVQEIGRSMPRKLFFPGGGMENKELEALLGEQWVDVISTQESRSRNHGHAFGLLSLPSVNGGAGSQDGFTITPTRVSRISVRQLNSLGPSEGILIDPQGAGLFSVA